MYIHSIHVGLFLVFQQTETTVILFCGRVRILIILVPFQMHLRILVFIADLCMRKLKERRARIPNHVLCHLEKIMCVKLVLNDLLLYFVSYFASFIKFLVVFLLFHDIFLYC